MENKTPYIGHSEAQPRNIPWRVKAKGYSQLLKFRLSLLVAMSSVFGYAMAAGSAFTWWQLGLMGVGGLLITGAANALNQIIEKEYDGQMARTSGRPLPVGVLTSFEAFSFALLLAVSGLVLIGTIFNMEAAALGFLGLMLYAFVYTPLKRISSISVFVGAIPGALPPLIGWVAFTGTVGAEGLLLFAFQFFWQFPHFWAIAWLLDDEYKKAGFKMLPSNSGKSKFSASLILIYTICLIPMAYFPLRIDMLAVWAVIGLGIVGAAFVWPALRLHKTMDAKYAKRLMFASFLYLPLIQIIFLAGS